VRHAIRFNDTIKTNNKIMELRVRTNSKERSKDSINIMDHSRSYSSKDKSRSKGPFNAFTSEMFEMGRVALKMVQGRGSTLAYLLIPALISLMWFLVCFMTVKNPNLTLEERLAQKHLRVS
jgi:hypothetical protein